VNHRDRARTALFPILKILHHRALFTVLHKNFDSIWPYTHFEFSKAIELSIVGLGGLYDSIAKENINVDQEKRLDLTIV
jgi:hypothetical protein